MLLTITHSGQAQKTLSRDFRSDDNKMVCNAPFLRSRNIRRLRGSLVDTDTHGPASYTMSNGATLFLAAMIAGYFVCRDEMLEDESRNGRE